MQAISRTKARTARVSELLREKIALILLHKSRDPRLRTLTVTEVAISKDLRRARVFYQPRCEEELPHIQAALERASGFIKQELGREQILRVMPEITFLHDESWQRGARIEKLLCQLQKETPETDGSEDSS
ncbi:MAG: 30S ribosome-binding factor RbfA [Deltaproteobacteria bacterium]|nr:30S ribosome-binding factor RbfA [Deltaproteobacteria bacterium]MBW1952139.1 30S ribosome-binding factor RbfA [Deltaproteobacteria bacterium]